MNTFTESNTARTGLVLPRRAAVLSWALQLVAAGIMGQTLFFKFTAAPEAVALFERLGAEPYGRLATGALELVAVVLLLVPGRAALGAVLTIGLMLGAVLGHVLVLGIEVEGDGGTLFALALVTLASAAVVLGLRRAELAPFYTRK